MKTLSLNTRSGATEILIGAGLHDAYKRIGNTRSIIITDKNVHRLHRDSFPEEGVIVLQPGEKHKSLETVDRVYNTFLEAELDRQSFILGVGGGIVCDLTGFVASTYSRGLKFGFVASTLLAQVDAAIGGKNGINYKGYKNMVGVIRQPEFIINDLNLLETLPQTEYISGLAEVVKYGCIADPDFFEFIEAHSGEILLQDSVMVEEIIYRSAANKIMVVESDEQESGPRKMLNFGHTLGHAIEKLRGWSHGFAVSAGMMIAAELSVRLGFLDENSKERLITLLRELELPVEIDLDASSIYEVIRKDKKRGGKSIDLILLHRLGDAFIYNMELEEFKTHLHDLC